ncbi:replicative DNA helicase [Acerihabitans sp. TG2]|uniref:replicative DNA helicase n=1 Tax=Acerihabitans sp. TG2 TaxID=3096008 RepID=UPI002B2382A0|nr:replicative DNA helicase [Acerihabitans sp. TG2]MEA9392153.1 replicative DNA helicase [Acerihabitans sp. TG2]
MSESHNDPNTLTKQLVQQLKSVPYSLEAEQAVLGALMLDNELWDSVAEIVSEDDYFNRGHRIILAAMGALVRKSSPIDLLTLSDSLEQKEQLELVGGFAYLAELSKNTPSTANCLTYANIVRERAVVRGMIAAGNRIVDAGMNTQGKSSDELIDYAEKEIYQIAENRANSHKTTVDISTALTATINRIEELISKPHNGVTGIDTGFADINAKTSGLQPGDLIIIAARPSMGKTTFAMNICENAAMENDKPVMIFSLEMPTEQLTMKMLASQSRVDLTKIRTGVLDDEDWGRLASTVGILAEKNNIHIDDEGGLTPTQVRSRARRLHREHGGLSLIMVDYLQLMRVPEHAGNRTQEISEISRALKELAKELNVPVVALSQLNRLLEQRADKRPVNSDLRESGSIEQDADVIMFIYRDEVYNDDSEDKGAAEIIIGKQRNGPIGRVRLLFNGAHSRFDNLAGYQFNQNDY